MDGSRVETILDDAERAVAAGSPLAPSGFWKAVAFVKRDPSLVDLYAERIARIDRAALKGWALVTVPLWLGNVLMIGGTSIGLVLVAWAYNLDGAGAGITLLIGFGIVLVTTHGLAHIVAGRFLGMRFTHWFIGAIRQPQPGVKVDYATYLRAPAWSRARMHAAGALLTKILPFVFIGVALSAGVPGWTIVVLLLAGIVQIATDILWSTRESDWKKYRREMALVDRPPAK